MTQPRQQAALCHRARVGGRRTVRDPGDIAITIRYGDDVVLDPRSEEGQYHVDAGGAHLDDWPDPLAATTTGEDNWFAVIWGTGRGHAVATS
ncbi:hypothetical protein [Amycolatopsis sp. NPDC051903]|uniref:hypothetical protein n=1 Tax=Amycolatopsis sp. NPDC051903 TaxID=3363936 RepID=UPI0037A9A470